MAKLGRKPIDFPLLVWLEGRWRQLFELMRDGHTGGVELDGIWLPPEDLPGLPPVWMTSPGAVHDWQKDAREKWFGRWAYERRHSSPLISERKLWNRLKQAETARQVKLICRQSRLLGSSSLLYQRADEFVRMLNGDARYPRKARTKDDQRILYCARVMAAIALRISPYTALDRLRKLKNED
jgi:hypothetical protein